MEAELQQVSFCNTIKESLTVLNSNFYFLVKFTGCLQDGEKGKEHIWERESRQAKSHWERKDIREKWM